MYDVGVGGGVGVGVGVPPEAAVHLASSVMSAIIGREKSYFSSVPLRYQPSKVYPERVGASGSCTGLPVATTTVLPPPRQRSAIRIERHRV